PPQRRCLRRPTPRRLAARLSLHRPQKWQGQPARDEFRLEAQHNKRLKETYRSVETLEDLSTDGAPISTDKSKNAGLPSAFIGVPSVPIMRFSTEPDVSVFRKNSQIPFTFPRQHHPPRHHHHAIGQRRVER